jgi:hypothetical protein
MANTAEKIGSEPSWLELEAVIPLITTQPGVTSVKNLTSLSPDTVERLYGPMIVQLSPRRRGMKLRNALKIARGEASQEIRQ